MRYCGEFLLWRPTFMKFIRNTCFILLTTCTAVVSAGDDISEKLAQIELPPGFEIHLYAEGVKNARQLALGDNGTVFAGSRKAGLVHAVWDRDRDHFVAMGDSSLHVALAAWTSFAYASRRMPGSSLS